MDFIHNLLRFVFGLSLYIRSRNFNNFFVEEQNSQSTYVRSLINHMQLNGEYMLLDPARPSGHQGFKVSCVVATHSITWPRRFPKPELKLGKGWNEDDQGSFVSEVSSRQAQRAKLEILGQRSQTERRRRTEAGGRLFGRQRDLPLLSGSQCSGLPLPKKMHYCHNWKYL